MTEIVKTYIWDNLYYSMSGGAYVVVSATSLNKAEKILRDKYPDEAKFFIKFPVIVLKNGEASLTEYDG